jgi:hypothetical protein
LTPIKNNKNKNKNKTHDPGRDPIPLFANTPMK